MGKTSERLEAYQIQMSIYAEQHKIILASDVLDMIEQLQDDLKDDIEKVVAELEVMEEKRVRFAKQILDYWDKQGTQQTILFLKDIVENSEVQNERIYRKDY